MPDVTQFLAYVNTILSRLYNLVCILLFMWMLLASSSYAGSLDKFEDSVKDEPKSKEGNSNKKSCKSDELSFGCFVSDIASNVISHVIVFGGTYSFYRINSSPQNILLGDKTRSLDNVPLRLAGEPLIPFVRLDLGYQRNDSRTKAHDYRFETGYGAIALAYSQTRYRERQPKDSLKLTRVYGLYRMSFGPHLEVDWGIGSLEVHGNEKKSYLYITTPILIHPYRRVGFEFRPSWAGNVAEYDLSVLLKSTYMSTRFGYRKLSAGSESLQGPYIGLSVHY